MGSQCDRWAGLASLDGSSFFQTGSTVAQTQNGLGAPLGHCVTAGKPRLNFVLDVFKGNALLWDLQWLVDVVRLSQLHPGCWEQGIPIASKPHHHLGMLMLHLILGGLSRASLKHSMLFLHPQLLERCKGLSTLDFIPTHVSGCLRDREKLHAELRSTGQICQTGWMGRVSFPDTCWIMVGSGRHRRC